MLDLLKKAFCCRSTKRESPLSAYSLESTQRPEDAIAEQPELHFFYAKLLNFYAKLLDGCPTETLSTPPTVFEESAQEGWPELAPDAPLRWQALIRPLPEQGDGIEIVNESKDEKPPDNTYNSPKPGLDDLY